MPMQHQVQVEHFDIPLPRLSPQLDGLKVVHLSDIHLSQNLIAIDRLLALVARQQPDLIAITGDLIDRTFALGDPSLPTLVHGLAAIAPTYAVSGNHEYYSPYINLGIRLRLALGDAHAHALAYKSDVSEWAQIVSTCGATVLDGNAVVFSKHGASLILMGLRDNAPYSPAPLSAIAGAAALPRLLLAHRPERFTDYSNPNHALLPDVVLSGHAHGGQFRLPGIGGLYAPNQGLFPKYDNGLYTAPTGVQLLVSRGLGSKTLPLRPFNRPHLPVLVLRTANRPSPSKLDEMEQSHDA